MPDSISISKVVRLLFEFYFYLIILRIFLTWIPSIDWHNQPFAWLRSIVDPFLNIFRGIIPPAGMIDFSPILAILLLELVKGLLVGLLINLGL
jgi:YggT family protein